MKFFHLSDLHLGLKLMNHNLSADQAFVLHQIVEMAAVRRPDAVVISGDIYDKALPSAEAVSLFDRFLTELTSAVPEAVIMLISGNHDSAVRVNQYRELLKTESIHMIGLPPEQKGDRVASVTCSDTYGPVTFYLLPYIRPSMVKEITGTDDEGNQLSYDTAVRYIIDHIDLKADERNILVSHQFYLPAGKNADEMERMDSEIVTVGNIDSVRADMLTRFDYAALGHIHKAMDVGGYAYRYSGTPWPCSVSEAGQVKGILEVELKEKGRIEITKLPLEQLHEVRLIRGELTDVLLKASDDYVTVILTDRADLNVIDMQDRLRSAFPNLLEIRRENLRTTDYSLPFREDEDLSPFELCRRFLGEVSEEEEHILREIINENSPE